MDDKAHDYQNEMSLDTRSIDTAGEIAAEKTTAETAPPGEQRIVMAVGNQIHYQDAPTFGVLPAVDIPADYTVDRMLFFKDLAVSTGSHRNPLNRFASARGTAAFKSQMAVADNYMSDLESLRSAQRAYDLLIPPSTLAAKSFAKLHTVGEYLGFSDLRGPKLSPGERKALSKASVDQHHPIGEEASLEAASRQMIEARMKMDVEAGRLAASVDSKVVDALRAELEKATSQRAAIERKMKTAERAVKFLASAAGLVSSGGSAFKAASSSASTAATVESVGKKVKDGATYGGDAIALGLKLYYEDQLAPIQSEVQVVSSLVDTAHREQAEAAINAAFDAFTLSQLHYKNTVDTYRARINDRRKQTASLGHSADQIVDRSGANTHASDAMLWTTTVMETQSLLSTARTIAVSSNTNIAAAFVKVAKRRSKRWGTLDDVMEGNTTPRCEGMSGPDARALTSMRDLVSNWVESSEPISNSVEHAANSQARPVLAVVGHEAAY